MTYNPFPTPERWTLPGGAFRQIRQAAPSGIPAAEAPPEPDSAPNMEEDALAERISQEIARRARQRRYTG